MKWLMEHVGQAAACAAVLLAIIALAVIFLKEGGAADTFIQGLFIKLSSI